MDPTASPAADASTSELVSRASAQISTLIRDELALAKAELTEKGKRAGLGGGLFGGAAVLGAYGLGLLLILFVVLLDLVSDAVSDVYVIAAARGVQIVQDGIDGHIIWADPRELTRAIGNLLANGVRHAPDDSTTLVADRSVDPLDQLRQVTGLVLVSTSSRRVVG